MQAPVTILVTSPAVDQRLVAPVAPAAGLT